MTSRRSVARHIIRHKAGKWALTFYVVNQSEQEAVLRQWIFDSGINKHSDHSAENGRRFLKWLLSNETGIFSCQCGLPSWILRLHGY